MPSCGDESEEFQRQTALLEQAWKAGHRERIVLPGVHHLNICDAFADPARPLHAAALRLLDGTAQAAA